jgi:hypothetical protein
MNTTCVGGGARRLVDARFSRTLSAGERSELEQHLVACAACSERYRRMQLAERVATVGADRALAEPSPFEVERIAADLGLVSRPVEQASWWSRRRAAFAGFTAAAAVAASLILFAVRTPPPEQVIERGAAATTLSFAVYVIGDGGAIRVHDQGSPVRADELLKLRASWTGVAPRSVAVAIVDAEGKVDVAALGAPKGAETGATIPGAVALAGRAPGNAIMYLFAFEGAAADRAAIAAAVENRPESPRLPGALAVERRELPIEEARPK